MSSNFHHNTASLLRKQLIYSTHNKKYLLWILLIVLISCGGRNDSSAGRSTLTEKYPDGDYCAEVTYCNPNTGTKNTYTLNVEVEGNELTQINWPNGGWLDNSHFSPEELDENGSCSFVSDRGYEYDVQITGPPCSFTDDRKVRNDKDETTCPKCGEEKSYYGKYCDDCMDEICPRCGRDKYSWKKYCNRCIDEEENTCSRCGSIEYYVYGGLCNNCKRQDEEEEKEERRRSQDEDN